MFELEGELDSQSSQSFQNEALQAVEAGAQYAILDLSRLSYISSAGLRSLLMIAKALATKAGMADKAGNSNAFKSPYLKLLNPPANVRQALDLMGFTMSMEIYSELTEAIASF
jgi:anti-anti-sigma factor